METRIFVKTDGGKLFLRELVIASVSDLTGLDDCELIESNLSKDSDWVTKLSSRYCKLGYFPHLITKDSDNGFLKGYPDEVRVDILTRTVLRPNLIGFEKFYGTNEYKYDSLSDLFRSHHVFKSTLRIDKVNLRKLFTKLNHE